MLTEFADELLRPPVLASKTPKYSLVCLVHVQGLEQMLKRVGGPKLQLKPEVETVLTELADELLGQALSFGCSMARQRQKNGASAEEQALQPADVAAFLEHSWSVLTHIMPNQLHAHMPSLFLITLLTISVQFSNQCPGCIWVHLS